VHQSVERAQAQTRAWITDALAHGEKVLFKRTLSTGAPHSTLDQLNGTAMAALSM
jgi:hypothetical protein